MCGFTHMSVCLYVHCRLDLCAHLQMAACFCKLCHAAVLVNKYMTVHLLAHGIRFDSGLCSHVLFKCSLLDCIRKVLIYILYLRQFVSLLFPSCFPAFV